MKPKTLTAIASTVIALFSTGCAKTHSEKLEGIFGVKLGESVMCTKNEKTGECDYTSPSGTYFWKKDDTIRFKPLKDFFRHFDLHLEKYDFYFYEVKLSKYGELVYEIKACASDTLCGNSVLKALKTKFGDTYSEDSQETIWHFNSGSQTLQYNTKKLEKNHPLLPDTEEVYITLIDKELEKEAKEEEGKKYSLHAALDAL